MSDSYDPTNPFFISPGAIREIQSRAEQANRVGRVTSDVASQISKATNVEWGIEVHELHKRAAEFDYLLALARGSVDAEPCTLEQAAAGWVRHKLADAASSLAAQFSTDGDARAEYLAQSLEHQAAVLRWMGKMIQVAALTERVDAARNGGPAL